MKNKKVLYLLVPLTIILWGLIIFKIVSHFNQSSQNTKIVTIPFNIPEVKEIEDTFYILANYSDPFLDRRLLSVSEIVVEPNIVLNNNNNSNPVVSINWPRVQYGGIISNTKNNSTLYLVQINGTNHLMKPGEQAGQIRLVTVFKDSIILMLDKDRKTIIKEIK